MYAQKSPPGLCLNAEFVSRRHVRYVTEKDDASNRYEADFNPGPHENLEEQLSF
jgi:hypothetical protein